MGDRFAPEYADTFVFDKTGTLTRGDLEITSVHSFAEDMDEAALLSLVASLEEHATHPIAEAVVQQANQRRLSHISHGEVDFIIAHGLQSRVDGTLIRIGSRHFLEEDEGIDFKAHDELLDALSQKGFMVLLVARDNVPLGAIALRDVLRSESPAVIEALREQGVEQIVMLTGDHREKAEELGRELGIDTVRFELVPEQKASIVEKLIARGHKVALVGDSINDSPTLAAVDVGLAMPRGAALTRETADVALLRDDLSAVLEARLLAQRTMDLIRQNFNITVGANSGIMLGAIFGYLSPVGTSLLHNGTTIGVLLNALGGVSTSEKLPEQVKERWENLQRAYLESR
uniref:P-type Zn(2+) transporter n=1 Tax=Candidatus Kentrum sp. FW TaxID=2126338 RepID=A0A450TRH5_9GAMM|nr:MAG: ATPase, P-type (transporting), HAD superfamily, subfamily IC [Candidatus Kentron sp. FW]